jgi:hypothetical protein
MELIRQDEGLETKEGVTEQIVGWMTVEVGRIVRKGSPGSYAATDIFVLLNWACGIYSVCSKTSSDFTSTRSWPAVIGIISSLLELLLSPTSHVKPAVRKNAVTRVRRTLRSVCQFHSPCNAPYQSKRTVPGEAIRCHEDAFDTSQSQFYIRTHSAFRCGRRRSRKIEAATTPSLQNYSTRYQGGPSTLTICPFTY